MDQLNPEKLLENVAKKIATAPVTPTGKYCVTSDGTELLIQPIGPKCRPEIVLFTFAENDRHTGFTSQQWKTLQTSIVNFLRTIP